MRSILLLLFILTSTFSWAQIETIENFDGLSSAPPGWGATGWFFAEVPQNCDQTTNVQATMSDNVKQVELTTPYQVGFSNGTDLTINYDLKVARWSFFNGESLVDDGWGYINIEYTTDSITWVSLDSISSTNLPPSLICMTRTLSVPAADLPVGANFQFRLRSNQLETQYFVYIDNLSITQEASTIPNCDASLTNPADGDTLIEIGTNINWASATGLPTGYKISIGTTPGGTDVADAVDVGNVNTYTPAMALDYSTTYYVQIVSYNAFGDATSCSEQSFSTRNPPIEGANCDNPFVISSFPYNHSGSIDGYDNDYQMSECNDTYMKGFDVVYQYTPTELSSINVRFDTLMGSRTAIHVLDGCPDEEGLTCLAYFGAFNPKDQYFENLILEADHTYYIVIASSAESSIFSYHLEVTKNPCVIPAVTLLDSADCVNGEYYVHADITRFGDGTSLTISDNQGNESQQVTEIGKSMAFGPYATGMKVEFSVVNDQNDFCTVIDSIEFHCPPLNDDCINAFSITPNADLSCTNVTQGTLRSATFSTGNPTSCDFTLVRDVWFSFEATNDIHTIEILNVQAVVGNSTTVQYQVLSGSCSNFVSILCNDGKYNNVGNLEIGQTYYVRVLNTSATSEVSFDICVSTPAATPSNDKCSNATEMLASTDNQCDNLITGTTISAFQSSDNNCTSAYNDVWYSFTPTKTGYYTTDLEKISGTATTNMSFWSGTCGDLTIETSCSVSASMSNYVLAGQTYYIMVRSRGGNPGVDFTLCTYQIFPPANNECSTPVLFSESTDETGNNVVVGTNNGATYSSYACYSNSYEGVWYSFTPKITGEYIINFENIEGSGRYTVYEEDCDNLSFVSGINSCYNNTGTKTIDVVAGNTYKVSLHSTNPFEFAFFVYPVIPAPTNDLCSGALELTESDETCNNQLFGTTLSAGASDNDCSGDDYNVWYTFTPTNSGLYQFNTSDNVNIALYSGPCDTLVQQSANCNNSGSFLQDVVADLTYTILVSSSSEGDIAGVDFSLCTYPVTALANNDCSEASLFMESADDTGENTVSDSIGIATNSSEACYGDTYVGVWYTFTPMYSGQYTFDYSGTGSYAIYSGSCDNASPVTMDCYNNGVTTFEASAGETYLVSVHTETTAGYDFFVYPSLAAPANNDCAVAGVLDESSNSDCNNMIIGSTLGSTNSSDNTCDVTGIDVWYTFTPASTGTYQFDLTQTSGTDAMSMALFTGDCGNLGMLSADCSTSLSVSLIEGTNYILVVTSDNTTLGVDFELCAYRVPMPPANDDCEEATSFLESEDETGNNLVAGNTVEATNSDEGCYANSYEGVWFEFTAENSGNYTVDFTGLVGDPAYTVYNGTCGNLDFAEGINANCYNSGESNFIAVEGETYVISVHAEDAATFDFFVYYNPDNAIEDLMLTKGLKYYPNPVSADNLNFEANEEIVNITIYNALGQKVINDDPKALRHEVDMSRLLSGVYFVKITIDDKQQMVKVIKE